MPDVPRLSMEKPWAVSTRQDFERNPLEKQPRELK